MKDGIGQEPAIKSRPHTQDFQKTHNGLMHACGSASHCGIARKKNPPAVSGCGFFDGSNDQPASPDWQATPVAIQAFFRPSFFNSSSRNSRRRILPTLVVGSASRNSTERGTL